MDDNEIRIPGIKEAIGVVLFIYILSLVLGSITQLFFGDENIIIEYKELQIIEIIVFIPLFLYLKFRKYPLRQTLRLRPIPLNVVAYSIAIGLSITVLISELDFLISIFFPVPEEIGTQIEQMMTFDNWWDGLLIVITTVFAAGLLEEMLFRGFFLRAIHHQKQDITYAVLFTALIFSLFHIPWWYLQSTVFGIILGVMAWKSDSIYPPAIAHSINNLVSIVLLNTDKSNYWWYEWHGHISPPFIIMAAFGIVWGFNRLYHYYD